MKLHASCWMLLLAVAAHAQTALQTAQKELQNGNYEVARAGFESTLRVHPHNALARDGEVLACERQALAARSQRDDATALEILIDAKKVVPDHVHLLYDLGVLEEQMNLVRDADKTLTEAEKLAPHDAGVLYALARVKMDLGDMEPAEVKMQAYLAQHPNDASAHFGLARIYQISVQFDKAKSEFARSIALQPVQTESYFELGSMALKQGEYEEALTQFSHTLERDPHHGGALEGAGEACFQQKHYQQAVDYLQRATEAAPTFPPGHYYLGLALARLGRKDESRAELDRASELANETNKSESRHPQIQEAPAK